VFCLLCAVPHIFDAVVATESVNGVNRKTRGLDLQHEHAIQELQITSFWLCAV